MGTTRMRGFISAVAVLLLVGCADLRPARPSCEEIMGLQDQVGKRVTIESFRNWVSETYNLPLDRIAIEDRAEKQICIIRWDERHVSYSVALEDLIVTQIGVSFASISAGQMVVCLGDPDQYRITYSRDFTANNLSVDLLYPGLGILVTGNRYHYARPKQPPMPDDHFIMSGIVLMPQMSAEQMLREMYSGSLSVGYEQALREYRPWPGAWENAVIQIDPSLRP